jgi:uncharacterized protein
MSLAFPDVNVWLALASEEHVRRRTALEWWRANESPVGFCRITQMGLLRLLTTAVVMNHRPLSMREAWQAYDGFLSDERVEFVTEPLGLEPKFGNYPQASNPRPNSGPTFI